MTEPEAVDLCARGPHRSRILPAVRRRAPVRASVARLGVVGALLLVSLGLGCSGAAPVQVPAEASLAQAAEVLAAVRADPRVAVQRCPELDDAALRAQCEDIGRRPHLGDPGAKSDPAAVRRRGDVGRVRARVVQLAVPGSWPAPVREDCSGAVDAVSCAERAAIARMRAGDLEGALARCAAVPEGPTRGDCAFRAAESVLMAPQRPEPLGISRAARLCRWSVPFQADCLRHLAGDVARLAPMDASGRWSPLLEGAAAAGSALGAPLGPALVDEILALGAWMHQDSRRAPCVATGAPAVMQVHLRSALAWRVVQTTAGLDAAVAAVLEGASAEFCPSRRAPRRDYDLTGHWSTLRPGEEAVASAAFLGTATRAVAPEEPAVDAALAVLEASARWSESPASWWEAGRSHADWRVRWTAARLAATLGAPLSDAGEPHPLVRGRLSGE